MSRWIYDLFYRAVYALENGIFLGIEDEDIQKVQFHPITGVPDLRFSTIGLTEICQHQITLSNSHLLKTYDKLPSVRPFSFFTLFSDASSIPIHTYQWGLEEEIIQALEEGKDISQMSADRDRKIAYYWDLVKQHTPLYSGSTTTDTLWPIYRCDNNEPIPEYVQLKTVSEALKGYFTHKEMKAANPGGCGVMGVRRVHITAIKYMGKEVS
ncbi:hypothetical protein, partial [Cedecea sp.]|uniref:hypothetical protein n=1 Tax=Cedecea sp. TaxID=1970739 RepID=UPI002F422D3F